MENATIFNTTTILPNEALVAPGLVFYVLTRSVPVFVHAFGIYSLLASGYYRRRNNKAQFILLFWLSTIEMSLNGTKIVMKLTSVDHPKCTFVLNVIRSGFLVTQFGTTMVTMTLDRLVFIRQNIKYKVESAKKHVYIILCGSLILSSSITLVLFLTHETKSEISRTTYVFIWPSVDACILIVFIVSYTLIKITVSKRCKILRSTESRVYRGNMNHEMKVPFLIVLTFVTLFISIDVLYIITGAQGVTIHPHIQLVLNILIATGYSLDAVFYVYFCLPIRKMWRKKWSRASKTVRKSWMYRSSFREPVEEETALSMTN